MITILVPAARSEFLYHRERECSRTQRQQRMTRKGSPEQRSSTIRLLPIFPFGFSGETQRPQARGLFLRGPLCRLMLAPRDGTLARPLLFFEGRLGTFAGLFGSHAKLSSQRTAAHRIPDI